MLQPFSSALPIVDADGRPTQFGLLTLNQIISLLNGKTENGITTISFGGLTVITGTGSPAGVVGAAPGALYINGAGGAKTTLWVKETGTGASGWTGK